MKRFLLMLLVLGSVVGLASAQIFRSTVTGRVTDETGAVIPNVKVTLTNTDNGAVSTTMSGAQGYYTAPSLLPGPYKITAEAPGFKKYVHVGINLQTQQNATENIVLQVGSTSQSITVTSDVPLIDTASASSGQVLTTQEIENLPANGRSPIGFVRDEYGVVPKEKHALTEVRPFDNSGGSDFAMGGGNSQSNEILLNGVPNMQNSGRVSAFSPEMDAVSEISADQFESNAAYGDTSGGTVNITTKAGTNQFHGTISEFNETSALAARLHFQPANKPVPATRQNQYGLTFGGPVIIPKLYNGHDKMFFFYAFEGFQDSAPSSVITTIPTMAERNGDFSQLLALGSSYQLYNPYTATLQNGKVVRQPYAGNIITSPLNPVGQALLKYYPTPNLTGLPDGENNYFSNAPSTNKYYSNMGRLDYNFSSDNKAFFEYHESSVTSASGNIFNNIATGSSSITDYNGATLDDVQTFSPTLVWDNRIGFTRSWASGALPSTGFNPTALGFPDYVSSSSTYLAMPQMNISGYYGLGGKPGSINAFTEIQYFSMLTKVWHQHTFQIGPDIRVNKSGGFSPGYASGRYYFTSSWVNAYTGAPSPKYGAGLAELLLGLPDTGNNEFDVNAPTISTNYYFGGYIQDNWHARHDLTINLGLRVEHETAPVESKNRITVGFDPTAVNQVTQAAEAAYAANPIPQLPASDFSATGGLLFASSSHRSPYSPMAAYISPRAGFAWAPDYFHGKTVFRGGFGIFFNPFNDYYTGSSYGFQQANSLVPTLDNYQTPAATLSDPYPSSNPIQQPSGAALGVNTYLGQGISFYTQNTSAARSVRFSFDIQQQLAKNMMFDLGYVSSHQYDLSTTNSLTALPLQYLSQQATYDPTVTAALSKVVANPYAGLGPKYGKTTSVAGLLRPFTAFSSINQQLIPNGYSTYHMLAARITQRYDNGLQFNANFEWSRQLEASSQLNPGGPQWYGETASDFPIHFVLTGSYALPIGRGKMLLGNINHWADAAVGGWSLSSVYMWESGATLGWGNAVLDWNAPIKAQPRNLSSAFNTAAFDRVNADQPNSYNYRTFPSQFLRSDAANNADLSAFKTFAFGDNVKLQYRLDAFNAFNRTQFSGPNTSPTSSAFGLVNGQANSSRVIQMGLKASF
ncbi:MAG: carboxypeptidase-like regulatory domain-containing protein [Acidobacteriaceae bacterium]